MKQTFQNHDVLQREMRSLHNGKNVGSGMLGYDGSLEVHAGLYSGETRCLIFGVEDHKSHIFQLKFQVFSDIPLFRKVVTIVSKDRNAIVFSVKESEKTQRRLLS